jgi:propane monooxygenase small subunit
MLVDDEAHGDANREVLQGWLRSWSEDAIAAARQLQPIWSQISEKVVRFEDSLERSRDRQSSLLGDIGLETTTEVPS